MRRLACIALASAALSVALLAACSGSSTLATGGDGAASSSSGMPATPCDAGAVCSAGHLIGTISGDTADAGLTATGTTSAWVHVRVTEDNDDWSGHPVALHATLTSPGAADFELHAFLDTSRNDDAGLDCAHEVGTVTSGASGASVDVSWGDPADASANGVDDGRTVALEIRHVAGECHAGVSWTLEVHGGP
ncbi:MAG: hypothetical protein JWP97_6120 [Labilithrix sp.]|nr:hypothetical protein [Labilithrix sp.]